MKPKVLCSECGTEMAWGTEICPGCGKPVEWEEDATETVEAIGGTRACGKCGTENADDAAFCSSCGARLQGGGKQQQRQASKQGRGKEPQRKTAGSNPLFSWKVILGFIGVLAALVIAVELFTPKAQAPAPAQEQAAGLQGPTANMQLMSQIADLEKQLAANPSDMQLTLKLANLMHDGRFFDKAIVYYKRFLDKNPKDANARVDLGICYFESNDDASAEREMKTALKYDPKHLQAHFNLGIVCLRARKIEEANEWFRKTIAIAPPNSEIGQQAKQFLEQHSSPLIQN